MPDRSSSGWAYDHPLVGKPVIFLVSYGEEAHGELVAVHRTSDRVLVRDRETGEYLVGNQWEEA